MRILLVTVLLGLGLTVGHAQTPVGQLAPNPEIESILNAPPLASWDALAGKAIVMDIWATWCAPCIATIPHLNALADSFAGRPIQFLSVTNEPLDIVEPFLVDRPIHGWVGLDDDDSAQRIYGVAGIPVVALVSPDGHVAAMTHPNNVTAEVLEALLAGDSLDVRPYEPGIRTEIQRRVAESRQNRPEVADGPQMFEAWWAAERAPTGISSRWQSNEGWADISGSPLKVIVASLWSHNRPFGERRRGPTLWNRIDAPDSLLNAPISVLMNEPGLAQEDFPGFLLAGLARQLELAISFEEREQTVFTLRRAQGTPLTLTPDDGKRRSSSNGNVFSVSGSTIPQIALALERSLGRPIQNEIEDVDGTYRVLLTVEDESFDFAPQQLSDEAVRMLSDALRAETGLELVPEMGLVEWMVVRPTNGEEK